MQYVCPLLGPLPGTDGEPGNRNKARLLHGYPLGIHLGSLPYQTTSAHARETWLFPGQRHGEHIHQDTFMNRLRRIGIDLLGAWNATLRCLVLEIQAPLVAEAYNYQHQVTEKHRRASGAAFMDYITARS